MIDVLAGGPTRSGGATEALLKGVNTKHHCGNTIDKGFLEESIENADILVVSYDTNKSKKRGAYRGFACIQIKPTTFYIDLICVGKQHKMKTRSNRKSDTGKDIISAIKDLVLKHDKSGITLSALSHVVSYYEKYGFNITKNADCTKLPPAAEYRPKPRKSVQHMYTAGFFKGEDRRKKINLNSNYNNTRANRNDKYDTEGINMLWCEPTKKIYRLSKTKRNNITKKK
jgi:hypothetical protein